MSLGLFDVLGPVMHGPSSNHTGGAARIGYYAQLIMGQQPDRVQLGFHPAYMASYRAQQSHTGLIAGCLGFREYDKEFTRALDIANERGMPWTVAPVETEKCSRNTMRVTGWVGSNQYIVNGDSIGGGSIVIDQLNGIPVFLDGNWNVALLFGADADLIQQAKLALIDQLGSGVNCTYAGLGCDGRYMVCLCMSEEAPTQLPAQFRKAEEDGILSYRAIRPIYDFRDIDAEPLFTSFSELRELRKHGADLSDLAIQYEMRRSNVSQEIVMQHGRYLVSVIRDSLLRGEHEPISLIGGFADPTDGSKLLRFAKSDQVSINEGFTTALARAVILAEMNAASMRVVACPTGGSAGCLPAVLLTAAERYKVDDERLVRAFLVAALTGVIIGGKASFSGTVGGCQGEVGIGVAMGAAAVAWMAGASGEQAIHAGVIALKNMLGLSCDPPTPAAEVPCIKRNAMGVAVAFYGADMGMAGIKSVIAPDDVVEALADNQRHLPTDIKFGGHGGLAGTRSGKALMAQWQEKLKTMQ